MKPWERYEQPEGPWAKYGGSQAASSYAPIPEPVVPEIVPKSKPLHEQLWNQDTAIMSGASAGALVGAPAGPPGMLAGGILGAGAGYLLHDLSEKAPEIIETTRRGEIGDVQPMMETSRHALETMREEAMWAGGTMAAGPVLRRLGKPLVGKALGVFNPESRQMTDLAHGQGIELGATHVSERKMVKGMPKVLGVFPFVGTPYRRGQARVVGQLDERAADLLNTLAPASTRYDVAKGLTKAAGERYKKFDRVASALYGRFYQIADDLPVKDIVPSAPLKSELAEVAQREGVEQVTLQGGEPLRQFGTDAIGDWLKQLSDLPEHITVEQARGLERQLNSIMRTGAKEGWDVSRLSGMKQALTEAKNSLDVSRLSPETAQRVVGAWNTANEFFSQTRRTFESPTARRFGRVDKNIFRKGVFKPGTINEDQIFEAVYQAKSPEALIDLRKLVGPSEFKKASRKFLENTFNASKVPAKEGSIVGDMFSAADFEKRLGLNTQEGWDALGEMLKGSDVTVKQWKGFLEVAKKATDITIRDPSTFLTRRLVLGGGIMGGIVLAGNHLSLPGAAFVAWTARQGTKFLMSKNQLNMMTRILDDSTSDHLRRTLITRMVRLVGDGEDEAEARATSTRARPPGR